MTDSVTLTKMTMKVQLLYDLRNEIEFCNGKDLSEFFQAQTGEPSPKGSAQVDPDEARKFIASCLEAMKWNSPSLF